ncbi:ABC transporter permease [Pseudotabrizicola algicola]|uniref:Transport permease protein n=1 Tax=Pseudotabrizicola algicola TaxID=2709381 RepID=A0A6B3RXC6_9RHOB|nr:ABC transporter permease [Pseudotabrizicola algicola]NEX47749.1 ABC transporter permease [Pseudotabrizicola algicola]
MKQVEGDASYIPPAQRPASLRFRFFRSFSALILREMTTSYGRSPGGYLWAILEPVAGLALLSIVFSYIVRTPSLGNNFMYFFAGGLLPFGLYLTVSNTTAGAVRFSKALLEYPAVSFIDAVLARFVLNAMTYLLIMFLVLTGIIIGYNLNPILNWPSIFLAIAMALSLAFGVGVMNCFLVTSYPLWERAWAVANRPLFIISGILFIPENMTGQLRDILMLNPLIHITSEMRKGLFSTYDAVHVRPLYVFTIALVLTVLGLLFLRRYHKDIVLK